MQLIISITLTIAAFVGIARLHQTYGTAILYVIGTAVAAIIAVAM
jgi:hypothetical protein